MNDFEDFEIEFGGENKARSLRDGAFKARISNIKKEVYKFGEKLKGKPCVEWTFDIQDTECKGFTCIVTTFLHDELRWTTDRVVAAAMPLVAPGAKVNPLELIGSMVEIKIKTRPNPREGNKVSRYVQLDDVRPVVEDGLDAFGSVGSADSKEGF